VSWIRGHLDQAHCLLGASESHVVVAAFRDSDSCTIVAGQPGLTPTPGLSKPVAQGPPYEALGPGHADQARSKTRVQTVWTSVAAGSPSPRLDRRLPDRPTGSHQPHLVIGPARGSAA
jgi:hypothetical protein